MAFPKPTIDYWNNKVFAYLHDPVDKVLKIQGHEERAGEQIAKFGIVKPNNEFWKLADGIASGFERGQVPSYDPKPNKNGSVNFLENPVITHPTSKEAKLNIKGLQKGDEYLKEVDSELLKFLKKEIGEKYGDKGYSDKFKGDEETFSLARFLYIHLVLRFKLAEDNVAGLGALWHRLPADTRFPDHSIWQHNALTSALSSCMELSDVSDKYKAKENIGLMVFSITPVQAFIAKSRKLRDYWTGSVLLSWLAFEGMRWIIEKLGPDHIVYPSPIGQPLIAEYLNNEKWKLWRHQPKTWKKMDKDIASFPNKFLALVPLNKIKEITEDIQTHIKNEWINITTDTMNLLTNDVINDLSNEELEYLNKMFSSQCNDYWDFNWSAVKLFSKSNKKQFKELLNENSYKSQDAILKIFDSFYQTTGEGIYYSTTHSLVQTSLASNKVGKKITRQSERGEKCSLCGEFEVLHSIDHSDKKASEYSRHLKDFWETIEKEWKGDADFKKNEKLCSICLTKRAAQRVIKSKDDHLLKKTFKDGSFPSVTEVALNKFYNRNNINEDNDKKRKKIAQDLYEDKQDRLAESYTHPLKDEDKYYAILLMDGDKMGDLVNGKTMESTWKSIMHPEIVKRLKDKNFYEKYHKAWDKIFNDNSKRLITPAIHAAISESLGDFSIYSVAPIIKEYEGRLIYAGGDDVCAVMPVQNVFLAARKVQEAYKMDFTVIKNGIAKSLGDSYSPSNDDEKLSVNLGKGKEISISAGILICHHKENLSEMIKRSHGLLDNYAKNRLERNACAIELKKRSGGSRYFGANWNEEEKWDSFSKFGRSFNKNSIEESNVSTSLVYRLEKFRNGFEALKKLKTEDKDKNTQQFIKKQLDRSGIEYKGKNDDDIDKEKDEIAMIISKLIYNKDGAFEPERLIVAGFMGRGGE